jgi:hypothetical protein
MHARVKSGVASAHWLGYTIIHCIRGENWQFAEDCV